MCAVASSIEAVALNKTGGFYKTGNDPASQASVSPVHLLKTTSIASMPLKNVSTTVTGQVEMALEPCDIYLITSTPLFR